MTSRTKIIIGIITAWMLLVSLILMGSQSIFISGFATLERDLATNSANRVYHVTLSMLNYIDLQNLDNAYWDKAYDYMHNKNPTFLADNYIPDFYTDNKINYIILLNTTGKVVWSNGFDLKQKTNAAVESEILAFFKQHAQAILDNKDHYYQVVSRPYGASGFLLLADNSLAYFALNYIKDSNDDESPVGIMIYGKKISTDYLQQLSSDLSYPISLITPTEFPQDSEVLMALRQQKNDVFADVIKEAKQSDPRAEIINDSSVFTKALNDNVFLSYKLIKDFTNKTIGMFQIEQSRKIYNQSKHSTLMSQIILFVFSMLAMLVMSALVYLFFRRQDLITSSFERFVPHQLIELLLKKNILEVGLGDNSKRSIAVMFMDIRNFTTISEGLSPQANFDFINALLKKIAPVISDNNGFIDKYIGDAVMALFPNTQSAADDAVRAAKQILVEVNQLNAAGVLHTMQPVKVGIGINTGEVMLGIIGAEGRLEGTVISDMVNTASRIQSLTKTYGCEILISEQCWKRLKQPELYTIEHVDDVLVKGKKVAVSVYAVR